MALSRKMLAAMDIPAEKIDEIITAHTETVNALKEERDGLKEAAGKLPGVEKDLANVQKELDELKAADWEEKYNKVKGEYDGYKTEVETKATQAAKTTAYKKLLTDAGVSEKRLDAILKVTKLDDLKLDKDGAFEGADKLTEGIKTEWADFISTEGQQGAQVANPPANTGGGEVKPPSRASQLVAEYRAAHYGAEKEA